MRSEMHLEGHRKMRENDAHMRVPNMSDQIKSGCV